MIIGILPDLYCCFSGGLLFGNEWFDWGCFPSREGIEGCIMVRCAGWGEMILLLFGGVVFLGLRVTALILGSCARTSHTPAPSREGRFEYCFFI